MKTRYVISAVLLLAIAACKQPHSGVSNENTQNKNSGADTANMKSGVYFVNLKNGDTVQSPVIVKMGVKGMTVEPAGKYDEGKGHHHLIIDGSYVEKGDIVPKDETHLHFGKGQTVDTLKLQPGQHTLTLQFADGLHRSYGKDWSSTITITVKN